MKKLVVALTALMVSATAFGQGTVLFNNRVPPGIVAQITDAATGDPISEGWTAQLWAGATADSLQPIATTDFRPGNAAGFVNAITVAIPGIAGGSQAFVQIRAYNGADWDSSLGQGQSNVIPVTLGGGGTPPGPPANLVGLEGFTVTIVPEPTTWALGALGAVGLLLFRRRK